MHSQYHPIIKYDVLSSGQYIHDRWGEGPGLHRLVSFTLICFARLMENLLIALNTVPCLPGPLCVGGIPREHNACQGRLFMSSQQCFSLSAAVLDFA